MAPPKRKAKRGEEDMSYIYARAHLYPPARKRVRPPFQPWKINAKLFLVDRIRPYPEWPLICKAHNMLAFDDEKAVKKWLEKIAMSGNLYKMWLCETCKKWHYKCYPQEVSGTTSGKNTRKTAFIHKEEGNFDE